MPIYIGMTVMEKEITAANSLIHSFKTHTLASKISEITLQNHQNQKINTI
jgi:hypothetical protein